MTNSLINRSQALITEFQIVEITETSDDYFVGVNSNGQSFRFEPSYGDSIKVSWVN